MKNNDVIQAIKSRISLADMARRYVELRPAGSRLVAPCPFHQETKPSFSINEEQGTFYCFGCQASGDIFDFYGRMNGLDFKETLAALAEEAGIRLESYRADPRAKEQRSQKRDMQKMHELAASHFHSNLSSQSAAVCRDYIGERGISPELVEKFGLGWSMDSWQDLGDTLRRAGFSLSTAVECGLQSKSQGGRTFDRFRNRLMFPIRNLSGQTIAFGGRIIPSLAKEDDAKYINSSDSPIYKKGEHLFGLFQARPSIAVKKSIILTEGYMDVITLHQYGYTQAVGVLGTALTPEQIKRLSGFSSHLELMFDGDNAGRKAAFRSCEMLLTRGLSCRVILFPDDNDIDSMLHSFGAEAVEDLRAHAQDGLAFCLSVLRGMAPREAVEWARHFLSQVDLPELFHRFAAELAAGLGLSEADLRGGVLERRNASAPRVAARRNETPHAISRDKEIMTFAVRYPHRLPDLQAAGADLALSAPWALKLWDKIAAFCSDQAFDALEPKEKNFWIRCRGEEAPPLDNEEGELAAIRQMLINLQKTSHMASVVAALRQGTASQETQREYMRALLEARGRRSDQ
ncbi:DNA primase [uncultured Mailhella sp.]|uniref:DNA primase n=1 Tax=uncultured Mailhella sp. TaxID=1981031 RepID=UPI0025CC700B|nr:DNA primase [uncultured Mailhella sp.]